MLKKVRVCHFYLEIKRSKIEIVANDYRPAGKKSWVAVTLKYWSIDLVSKESIKGFFVGSCVGVYTINKDIIQITTSVWRRNFLTKLISMYSYGSYVTSFKIAIDNRKKNVYSRLEAEKALTCHSDPLTIRLILFKEIKNRKRIFCATEQ